jgi:pyrophosphatase PpaX
VKAVLLDFDGTLLDSVELILAGYRHMMQVHRGRTYPDELWRRGIGTPLLTQIREFARDEDEVPALLETYRDWVIEHHDRLARPFPGVADAIRALHAQGVALAIVTSKRRIGVERGLPVLGLQDVLTCWITPDEVTHGKPHPESVWLAMEQLGVDAAETCFVGDSPHDLEAGRAAGVTTVAVGWGPFSRARLQELRPDHWLDEPAQLATLGSL